MNLIDQSKRVKIKKQEKKIGERNKIKATRSPKQTNALQAATSRTCSNQPARGNTTLDMFSALSVTHSVTQSVIQSISHSVIQPAIPIAPCPFGPATST